MVTEAVVAALVGKGSDALADLRRRARDEKVSVKSGDSRSCLLDHLRTLETWSSTITLLSLLRDKRLQDSFVELSMDIGLVRHRRAESKSATNVREIAHDSRHAVILGGPGAGKTTSLQRIAQITLANWKEGIGGVPLLVRLRDLRSPDSLRQHLQAIVGLDVRCPTHFTDQMRRSWEKRALSQYLSGISAIILIDGLDETPLLLRAEVEGELRDLLLFDGSHRIILTCRTAEYTAALPNAQVYTLRPLSAEQVREFAGRWLGETAPRFIEAVARNPYAGSEVVPLTLAHLCAIFERDGELPPRPIEVYEQIISLLIEDWDKERRVYRTSRYADFSWRKKERFLQATAYHLAMRGRKGSFRSVDLREVYAQIAPEFGLPPDEAGAVIREIESHTGLVLEPGYGRFDFVHLVIQEFLTAMYAHRKAHAVRDLVPRFPNEMALVVAYSAEPDEYLEQVLELLVRYGVGIGSPGLALSDPIIIGEMFVVPFLARLAIERPVWTASARLGWTLLAFIDWATRHARTVDGKLRVRLPAEALSLFHDKNIADSIAFAAAQANRYQKDHGLCLIPKPIAQMPPQLTDHLRSRPDGGLVIASGDRIIHRLLNRQRRKPKSPSNPRSSRRRHRS